MTQQISSSQKTIKRSIFMLTLYFFLSNAPQASYNNVIIYLHDKYHHKGYGQTYLTSSSFAKCIGFILSPYILRKLDLTVKKIFVWCTILGLLYYIIPIFFTINELQLEEDEIPAPSLFRFVLQIIANCISGISQSLIGVLEGIVLAHICQGISEKIKSKYFSTYFGLIMFSNLFSPLITYFSLGLGNQVIFYLSLSLVTLSSLAFISFDSNFKISDPLEENKSFKYFLQNYSFSLKRMKNFIPSIILIGLMMGFVSGSLSHLLPKMTQPGENDKNIGITLCFFGIGSIFGSYICGFIVNRLSYRKSGFTTCLLCIITLTIELYFLLQEKSVIFACIVSFCFGFSLLYSHCFFMILITQFFDASSESFAVYRQFRLLFYIFYQWITVFINKRNEMQKSMIFEAIFLIVLATLALYFVDSFYKNKIKFQIQMNEQEISSKESEKQEVNTQIIIK